MTSEELAAAGISSTGKRFMDLRTFNLWRVSQFLPLSLTLRIEKMGRSDPRKNLVLKKISKMWMLIRGSLLLRDVQNHSLHPSFSVNLRSPQI
jgi:hypothetical protein